MKAIYKFALALTTVLIMISIPLTVEASKDGNGSEVDALGNPYELVPDPYGSGYYVHQCTDPNGITYYPGPVGTEGIGNGQFTKCIDPDTRAKITGPYAYKYCIHEYKSEVTKEPTCVGPGEMTYTCPKCNHTYTEEIPKTNKHDYKKTVVNDPECTTAGVAKYTCLVCGDEYEVAIPATGHNYMASEVKATCTSEGIKAYTCINCGDSYEEIIPKVGHTESDWIEDEHPTIFKSGSRHKECIICKGTLQTQVVERKSSLPMIIPIIFVICFLLLLVFLKIRKNKTKESL